MECVRVEFQLVSKFDDGFGNVINFDPKYVKFPTKKKKEDAGYDIFSAEDGVIQPHSFKTFHTGVRLAVPFGWYYEIKGRSSLGFNGVHPFIGTIDATYSGLLRVLLLNHSDVAYEVSKGDRIGQIIFHRQYEMIPFEVETFSEDYEKRGLSGFGSTGK